MEEEMLKSIEIAKLIAWLEEKGHTAEEILDCIKRVIS